MAYQTGKTKEESTPKDKPSGQLFERDLLKKFIEPLAESQSFHLTCNDDAAVIEFPAGRQMVMTSDTIIENIHFLPTDPPETVAKKALRVNLSDIAATGAHPIGYSLCLTIGDQLSHDWIEGFVEGLKQDNTLFNVSILGGDITYAPGNISISVTAIGDIAQDYSFSRANAQSGDRIYVTGTIGDAAVGLQVLKGLHKDLKDEHKDFLIQRYQVPTPRHILAQGLAHVAHSATDISDGLLSDLALICEASDLHAYVRLDRVLFSKATKSVINTTPKAEKEDLCVQLLTSGDDYELIFTASPGESEHVEYLAKRHSVPITCIGHLATSDKPDEGFISLYGLKGEKVKLTTLGYQHAWTV